MAYRSITPEEKAAIIAALESNNLVAVYASKGEVAIRCFSIVNEKIAGQDGKLLDVAMEVESRIVIGCREFGDCGGPSFLKSEAERKVSESSSGVPPE